MGVPYTFGTATTSIPLSQLDANFNTPVTLGNTTVGLGNTVTTVGNLTLTNVTITSGTINAAVVDSGYVANSIVYADSSGVLTAGSANLVFTGTNVGIGTSSPTFTAGGGLQISNATQANLRLSDTTNAAYNFDLFMNDADAYAVNRTSGPIVFGTNNTERMRIDSSGNVGIGCTPSAVGSYRVLELNNTTGGILYMQANGSRVLQLYGAASEGGLFQMGSVALTFGTASTERMRIDSSGNVQVGTTTSAGKVRFYQTADAPTLTLTSDQTGFLSSNQAVLNIVTTNSVSNPTTSFAISTSYNGSTLFNVRNDGNVGIGTSSPGDRLVVRGAASVFGDERRLVQLVDTTALASGVGAGIAFYGVSESGGGVSQFGSIKGIKENATSANYAGALAFVTSNSSNVQTERMRITSAGNICIGTTVAGSISGTGGSASIGAEGWGMFQRSGAVVLYVNRNTDDGNLVDFYQAGTLEGSISVSGTTVSYNGGHLARWSQLPNNQKDDTLLKGTVMSNLDDMCVWTKDGEVLPNEQLNKMKVSDVEGDTNVAGVFVSWTFDEQCQSDDMNVAMTGDMIIRIAEGVVVQKGDLLMSAGDGTAKPQGDDIVRSKTVAKVTSNHVTCTYADGSYCVPCVLMAC